MNLLMTIFLSIVLLFIGIAGIVYAYKLDKNKQKEIIHAGDIESILAVTPLWFTKFIIFIFGLIPIGATIAMWLQTLGIIE
jgi:hypothetical protein